MSLNTLVSPNAPKYAFNWHECIKSNGLLSGLSCGVSGRLMQSTPTAVPAATVEFNSPSFGCLKVMCYVYTYCLACLSAVGQERGIVIGNSSHLERDGSHTWDVLPTWTTLTSLTTGRAFLTPWEPDVQTTKMR